jgi:hypothetical protein
METFALGGLVGGALYKVVDTADSMIGHKDERYKALGWAAAHSTTSPICRRRVSRRCGSLWQRR